ncbi:MAG: hypothetical protein WA952_06840 [Lewinella sp.]
MRDGRYPGWWLALAVFVSSPWLIAQGPISGFPVSKGEIAIAPAYGLERYDSYFGEDGATEDRDVTTNSYSLFVEAGMDDRTSLIATLPYLRTNERSGSLQDASVWLKYNNLDSRTERGAHRAFTAVGLSFPVGDYETAGIAALGQRATVFGTRLVYQHQYDSGFFLHAQSGFDLQFAPESRASWPLLFRSGFGTRYYYVEGWLEFITALGQGSAVQTATATTGSSWQRAGLTLYLPITPWVGLTAGGAYVLGGEYIGRSTRINIGCVLKILPKD